MRRLTLGLLAMLAQPAQAEEMEELESKIMTRLSMPDPYIARDLGDA